MAPEWLTLTFRQRHLKGFVAITAAMIGVYVTDRVYLGLAGLIGLLILGDVLANDSMASVFLIRKLFHLVEYLGFWH